MLCCKAQDRNNLINTAQALAKVMDAITAASGEGETYDIEEYELLIPLNQTFEFCLQRLKARYNETDDTLSDLIKMPEF